MLIQPSTPRAYSGFPNLPVNSVQMYRVQIQLKHPGYTAHGPAAQSVWAVERYAKEHQIAYQVLRKVNPANDETLGYLCCRADVVDAIRQDEEFHGYQFELVHEWSPTLTCAPGL